jgi:tetratricopeptide (TPR) repeat protein
VAAGRQQEVEAVLDGSYRRTGDRLRLTAQLIRVADGAILWSAQFDERFTNIFSVQDSISERVACDLVTHVCGEASGLLLKQKNIDIEAYQAYLKGRHFWDKRTRDGYQKAIGYFERAIDIDPTYAQAYAGLADAILYRGGDNLTEQRDAFAKGGAALKKAIEMDETLAEPHATLGMLAMNVDWDWSEAERQFKRSIELNSNYATAHQWYGEFLAYMGRFDEAVAEIKRAQELDPLSPIISTDVAKVYALARRYDEAIEQYQRVLEMDPSFGQAHGLLGIVYSLKGKHADAVRELRQIKDLEDDPACMSWLVYVYGMAGRRDEAQRVLSQLGELSKRTYVSPFWMAIAHTGLGEKDQVFKCFERVFEERAHGGAITLKVNPIWDGLRSDPRYSELLRRADFAP